MWTGSPFSAVLQVLLIGWPLAALPLWLSSVISYLASGLAVALLITYLLGSSWKAGRLSMSLLVALFATGWFVNPHFVKEKNRQAQQNQGFGHEHDGNDQHGRGSES